MNLKTSILAALVCAGSFLSHSVFSQDLTVVAPASEAAEGLDLQAVAELFKEAKDLEGFEKSARICGPWTLFGLLMIF